MLQHLLRDITGNVHNGLIARAALGKLCDERVPVVVPAFDARDGANVGPDRLERGDVFLRIGRLR